MSMHILTQGREVKQEGVGNPWVFFECTNCGCVWKDNFTVEFGEKTLEHICGEECPNCGKMTYRYGFDFDNMGVDESDKEKSER